MLRGHFLIATSVFVAGVTAVVARQTYGRRHVPGARPFAVAMAAVSVWALLSAAAQMATGSVVFTFLYNLEWIPIGVAAVGWLTFGLTYTGHGEHVTRRRLALASVVPAVTAFVKLSHSFLIPVYADLLGPLAPLTELMWLAENFYHDATFVGTGYTYLLLAVGSLFLLEMLVERPGLDVGQVLVVFLVGPPWVLNALYMAGVLRFGSFDPTVLGFTVTAVAGLLAVGRFRAFDVPLARARLVDEIPEGVVVYGRDGRIYDYNERAGSLFGIGPDATGDDLRDVLAESPLEPDLPSDTPLSRVGDGTELRSVDERVPPGESPVVDGGAESLETALDGRTVDVDGGAEPDYVEMRLADLTAAGGKPVSRALLLYDVTAHERRKRELERSRERYRTLFENNQVIQWEMDLSVAKRRADELAAEVDDLVAYLDDHPEDHEWILDGMEPLDVNRRSVEFYEAASKDDLLENVDRVMTEDALESMKGLWKQLTDGERTFRSECKARTLGGETRFILLEMSVPDAFADDCSRVYMSALDISDRKRRERELERKNEFLDEFASVVSHDVATPLTVIENKARLVEMTGDTSHAEDIYEATERVETLVDELRTLASQGERVGETEPVDLEAVAGEAWRSVEAPAATLTVAASTTVEADRERLRQLLENLLTNAVEHGAANPQQTTDATEGETAGDDEAADSGVTVRVGALEDGAGFYVADDGPGIPPEERDAVFEQGVTTSDDGTGLGLAIVRRIVEGHGWTVDVTDSDDGGARFEVRTGG